MKKLRRVLAIFMAAVILAAAVPQVAGAKSKGFEFTYKKVTVSMHGKAAKLIKKAGDPEKFKAKKSCAYKGKDRTYQYKSFILYTYSKSDKGAEYVSGITFLDNKVSTPEGIKIGSSLSDVQKAYGKVKASLGIYIYEKGESRLMIQVKKKKVVNLRYTIADNN